MSDRRTCECGEPAEVGLNDRWFCLECFGEAVRASTEPIKRLRQMLDQDTNSERTVEGSLDRSQRRVAYLEECVKTIEAQTYRSAIARDRQKEHIRTAIRYLPDSADANFGVLHELEQALTDEGRILGPTVTDGHDHSDSGSPPNEEPTPKFIIGPLDITT